MASRFEYEHITDHKSHHSSHHFLRQYVLPAGNSAISIGWVGFIMMLWFLVEGIINICQFMYWAEWQFVVQVWLTSFNFGLSALSVIVLIVLNVWANNDIYRLMSVNSGELRHKDLARAKCSRANAASDLGVMLGALLFAIFELAIVITYYLGGAGNIWLNGKIYTVNYPITAATHFPAVTAAVINQVLYRSLIHLLIYLCDFIVVAFMLYGRVSANIVQEDIMRIYADGPSESGVSRDKAVELGAVKVNSNVPLMGAAAGGSMTIKVPALTS